MYSLLTQVLPHVGRVLHANTSEVIKYVYIQNPSTILTHSNISSQNPFLFISTTIFCTSNSFPVLYRYRICHTDLHLLLRVPWLLSLSLSLSLDLSPLSLCAHHCARHSEKSFSYSTKKAIDSVLVFPFQTRRIWNLANGVQCKV